MKIKPETARWTRRYLKALRTHIAQTGRSSWHTAHALGLEAVAQGLETLDLAGIHAKGMARIMAAGGPAVVRRRWSRRGKRFFYATVGPLEKTHHAAVKADVCVKQLTRTLLRRTAESSASTRSLKRNISLRQGAERSLKKNDLRHARLLSELRQHKKRLQDMTRALLAVQENERQRMSTHLRDEIAQTLIAIDLRLLMLRKSSLANAASLEKELDNTQQLVVESGRKVSRFAHEFAT